MIDLLNVSLQFGGKYLFRNINYKINFGDRISLVGANGSGKTSLLKIINSQLLPEEGKIQKQKRINIGFLPQENIIHKGKILIEEASSSLTDIIQLQEKETDINEMLQNDLLTDDEKIELVNQLGEVHHRFEELDYYSSSSKVEKILIGLGFSESDFEKLTDNFSGGWQMRIALAKILISSNDILLMDEPTNHLDIDSLQWLVSFLKSFKGSLLIVSHDKYFINSITNKTLEIFNGKFYSYNGSFDDYLNFKKEREIQLENQFAIQQKKIQETEKFIERFRYKATKAKQVQSRIKQLDKIELVDLPESSEAIHFKFSSAARSGKINIELDDVSKSYNNNVVLKNINFKIERTEKIAFVGPNGAGKTTLAKIIADKIPIDSGTRTIGHNTLISYYSQDVAEELNPEKNILETIEENNINKTIGQLRALLGCFLFTGDDVFKKIKVLSGGEKSRVALIKILLTNSNFIILDEPTNHLDMVSKELLQKTLIDFDGTLVIVSHDIDFLKPIISKVFEIRNSSIKTYLGGIDYYLSKRNEESDDDAQSNFKKSENKDNRKELKRVEAELRNKKYKETKDFKKQINILEKKIESLEKKFKEVELDLTMENIYSNPILSKEKISEYNTIKDELSTSTHQWEELNFKLMEVEDEFNRLNFNS